MSFKEFIQKALSEDNLIPSGMRVKTFYIVVIFVTVMALGFLYTVVFYKDLLIAYLGIISGLVVTALGAKYLQKEKEI